MILDVSFIAPDGSSVTCSVPASGEDDSDFAKADGKAMSYGIKYAFFNTLVLPVAPGVLPDPDEYAMADEVPSGTKAKRKGKEKAAPAPKLEPLKELGATELEAMSVKDLYALFADAQARGMTTYCDNIRIAGGLAKAREKQEIENVAIQQL